ncbi:MAG: PDGLE domain-containing protein, partial [bacterium]
LPDYGFKAAPAENKSAEHGAATPEPWPAVKPGTSVSGIVGGVLTLVLAGGIGFALKVRMKTDRHDDGRGY